MWHLIAFYIEMEKVFLMWSKNRWEDHSNAELFFKTLKVTVWSQEVYMKANCNLEIWTRVIMGRKKPNNCHLHCFWNIAHNFSQDYHNDESIAVLCWHSSAFTSLDLKAVVLSFYFDISWNSPVQPLKWALYKAWPPIPYPSGWGCCSISLSSHWQRAEKG